MTPDRLRDITSRYPTLRIAVVGDYCLDRYLEIDPSRGETSIETGLPVHNVVGVRAQPGGAGTVVANLSALGVGTIWPLGFCGEDGEGFELRRAMASLPGVALDHFLTTPDRRTFTYCKPLILDRGGPPVELSRLDSKNWTRTPAHLDSALVERFEAAAAIVDAVIVLEQVDLAETGVVTVGMLAKVGELAAARPDLPIVADSRRGLQGWPRVSYKMNAAELGTMLGRPGQLDFEELTCAAGRLATSNGRPVFVTLAERGLIGLSPAGGAEHVPALPVRGPIDVVGAGDSVTANLAAALSARATLRESLELAALASSHVVHQLGTTGVAGVADMIRLLAGLGDP